MWVELVGLVVVVDGIVQRYYRCSRQRYRLPKDIQNTHSPRREIHMKKQDAKAFAESLIIQFEHQLNEKEPKMPHVQRDAIVLGFQAGVERTLGAFVHIGEIKLED